VTHFQDWPGFLPVMEPKTRESCGFREATPRRSPTLLGGVWVNLFVFAGRKHAVLGSAGTKPFRPLAQFRQRQRSVAIERDRLVAGFRFAPANSNRLIEDIDIDPVR
jgi:hypothetical protein